MRTRRAMSRTLKQRSSRELKESETRTRNRWTAVLGKTKRAWGPEKSYTLERRIYCGTRFDIYSGVIYRRDQGTVATAIKTNAREDDHPVALLSREWMFGSVMRAKPHPNIVDFLDFMTTEDRSTVFLIMEFVHGILLSEILKLESIPIDNATTIRIALQLCDAVEALHAAGIVHRDIKPDNVILVRRKDGTLHAKLFDLDLAKRATERDAKGLVAGTPHYMAPEQARGEGTDYLTDLHSLGTVVYTIFARRNPFSSPQRFVQEKVDDPRYDEDMAIMAMHAFEEPIPLRERVRDIPQAINDAIMRALAKDRTSRFQSVEEFREALKAAERAAAL